jgi:riboflavin kinase/FMN adenylyltransferase
MGVYAGAMVYGKERRTAALSVGTNPTFGENSLSIEAHILDFDGDLYGENVEFQFKRFLREQKVFDSPEDLSAQMRKDIEMTRRTGAQLKH